MTAFMQEGKILKHTELGWEILVDNSSNGMLRMRLNVKHQLTMWCFWGKKTSDAILLFSNRPIIFRW